MTCTTSFVIGLDVFLGAPGIRLPRSRWTTKGGSPQIAISRMYSREGATPDWPEWIPGPALCAAV